MSGYRLHIDIPFDFGEAESLEKSKKILEFLEKNKMVAMGIEHLNYRLGHDEDRQKSNYFHKNENGHVNNKKSRIMFTDQLTSSEDIV